MRLRHFVIQDQNNTSFASTTCLEDAQASLNHIQSLIGKEV